MQTLIDVDSRQTINNISLEARNSYTDNVRHGAENRTLRHELRGGTAYGVPVQRFLDATFGIPGWNAALKLGRDAALNPRITSSVQSYLGSDDEDSLYEPFGEMVNDALQLSALPFRCVKSGASVLKGMASQRKPDIVFVRCDPGAELREDISWEHVLVVIELKRNKTDLSTSPLTYAQDGIKSINPRETEYDEGSQSNLNGREQLGGYGALVLSATALKRFTIAIIINFTKLELWYYDRAGAIGSATFDFREDFATLLGIMIAFGRGSSHTFGYLPELVDGSEYRTLFDGLIIQDVTQSTVSENVLSPSRNSADMITVEVVNENIASPQTMRRRNKADTNNPPARHAPLVLFGRGTTVYRCTQGRDSNLVVKISWQSPDRRSEVDFLHKARHIPGLPSLRGHRDISHLAAGLRGSLEAHADEIYKLSRYLPRNMILRAIVIEPHCLPLYSVCKLQTFVKAFKSLLQAHYDLSQIGILHRDINVNNLMVKASDPTHGVLIDLDFACELDQQGEAINGQYGGIFTMCTPFLALPRISKNPPPHIYRHDLESFLWTLIWISTYYENGVRNTKNTWERWHIGSWRQIKDEKKSVLKRTKKIIPTGTFGGVGSFESTTDASASDMSDFDSQSSPGPETPFEGCLWRLLGHVRAGYRAEKAWERARKKGNTDYDKSTAGGHIVFSNFMDEIDALLMDLQ